MSEFRDNCNKEIEELRDVEKKSKKSSVVSALKVIGWSLLGGIAIGKIASTSYDSGWQECHSQSAGILANLYEGIRDSVDPEVKKKGDD